MKNKTDITPEPEAKPEVQQAPVVVVPSAVFQQILDTLVTQPYADVGDLVNTLRAYKPQMANVNTAE